jgi:hypothetical protein
MPVKPRQRSSVLVSVFAGQNVFPQVGESCRPVLVTCDQGNVGSRAVIEACGGVLDSVVHLDGKPPALRFWID